MSDTIVKLRLIILLIFLAIVFVTLVPATVGLQNASLLESSRENDLLTVSFLDVGQGDAIYIETFDGVQLLIDGGPNSSVLRQLSESMPTLDRSLDVVLATHSDKDHVGGLVDVLQSYQIDHVILTENTNDTAVAKAFSTAVENEKVNTIMARTGQEINLGASTTLLIYSPVTNPEAWESNAASIVAQLRYGSVEFMLTGDAGVDIEEYLAKNYGDLLDSEVLKLGHHGSRTSTSDLFLDIVTPLYAVVSAGKDNSYGHPHNEVVDRLNMRDINIVSTAELGTVVFKSDGEKVWVE
jgi:competence protein ComEC